MKDNSKHEISESSCLCASVLKKDAGVEDRGFNTETQRLRGTEFKMTEIGLIPEDWECCKIGELAKICTGNRNTQDKNDNGRYPFYVRSPIVERIDEYGFNTEGVVTVGDGVGTGKVFHYVNGCFGLHQRCYLIDSFDVRLNSKYFYKVFSERFFDRVMQMTAKSSVDSVRREMITEMLIPVPPLHEQKAIAEALSDVDELLSAMTTLIEKKRAIKQGTMQELLTGKKRLVGFKNSESSCLCASVLKKDAGVVEDGFNTETQRRRGTEFKMTEIGPIPEDWEVKRLGEYVDVYDGTHQTPCYVEHGVPFYSVENVTANDFINTKCISWKEHQMLTRRHKIEKGDILMTRIGSIGVCRFVDWDVDASYYVSLALLKRKAKAEIDMEFLSFLSESDLFKNQVWQKSLQFAIPLKINLGPISDIKICIPPTLAEQRAIAEVLSDMDAEIEALEAKRAKYESIKQSMMQELLTGKTRLKD